MANLTITDQLLIAGHNLNLTNEMLADSVIINCEEIQVDSIIDDKVVDYSNKITKPPFTNAFYEFKIQKTPMTVHLSRRSPGQISSYLSEILDVHKDKRKVHKENLTETWLKDVPENEQLYLMNSITETGSESVTVVRFGDGDKFIETQGLFFRGADGYTAAQTQKIITDFNQIFLVLILNANHHIHSRGEIEFKDWTPRQRRATKSRVKKEPSPYFLLKIGHSKQVRYNDRPDDAPKTSDKRRAHIVRGHFRTVEDHPIEHFGGFCILPRKGPRNIMFLVRKDPCPIIQCHIVRVAEPMRQYQLPAVAC